MSLFQPSLLRRPHNESFHFFFPLPGAKLHAASPLSVYIVNCCIEHLPVVPRLQFSIPLLSCPHSVCSQHSKWTICAMTSLALRRAAIWKAWCRVLRCSRRLATAACSSLAYRSRLNSSSSHLSTCTPKRTGGEPMQEPTGRCRRLHSRHAQSLRSAANRCEQHFTDT